MDKIDYIKIESLPSILKEKMRKAEKALIKNDFCTNKQLSEVLSVKERQVQKIIQQLNECYGQANHITPGRNIACNIEKKTWLFLKVIILTLLIKSY